MEPNKDKRGNPFLIPGIIQHLTSPEINGHNQPELRNLRQISTLHHHVLNRKYFDQVEMAIRINKSRNGIYYATESETNWNTLEPEIWDPITLAPTVRKLFLAGKELNYLLSSKTTMVGGFNPLELIALISPCVTTLSLDLKFISENKAEALVTNFPNFLQQFPNLKHLKLQTYSEWVPSDLDQLEKFQMKIDNEISRELEIEFVLCSPTDTTFLEIILSPERRFITKNHKFSLYSTYQSRFRNGIQTRNWARSLTLVKKNSIPVRNFNVNLDFNLTYGVEERNRILNDLSGISEYVEELEVLKILGAMNNSLFTSYKWPQLKKLTIGGNPYSCPKIILAGLSTSCSNIVELNLTIIESESIFTNPELTDEENLCQIFGNCANTLKILRLKQNFQYFYHAKDERPKITPGSKILQYLQELLPNTLVEAEEFETPEDFEQEESSDSLSSTSEGESIISV